MKILPVCTLCMRFALWFVLNLTKSPDDAEDILQETFLRIWQTKENLSLETSFKSYLYTIAHNLIIDSFRKKN